MLDGPETSFVGALEELAYAYERVPFLREHLDRVGLRPEQVRTPTDLLQVPATQKRDYRRNFPARSLATGQHPGARGVFTVSTSGTTDERLITAHHIEVFNRRLFRTLRINRALWNLLRAETTRRYAMYAPPQCSAVDCANPRSTLESRMMPNGRLALPSAVDFLLAPPEMLDQTARELREFQPVLLDADPFRVSHLVRHLTRTGGPPLGVGCVGLGFCQTTPRDRRIIQEGVAPGTLVVETVGMSEFGKIAAECEHGNLHLNAVSLHSELIVDGRHARPGELAELYLTTIGDRLSPRIRYRTGDLYRLRDTVCPCGLDFPVVCFEGRKTQILTLPDGRLVTPRAVAVALADAPVRLFQLEQRDRTRFALSWIPEDDGAGPAPAALVDVVRELIGEQCRVDGAESTYLASEQSGKFLTCRTAVGVPPAFA